MKTSLLALVVLTGTLVEGRGEMGRHVHMPRRNAYNRRPHNPIDLMSDILSTPFYAATNSLMRQQQNQLSTIQRTAPRYAIEESEDGKRVDLTMEVPGVPAEDLFVEVENGNVLRIKGSRLVRENGSYAKSDFDNAFELTSDIDVEKIEVNLSHGILTVTAPKKEHVSKKIKISVTDESQQEGVAVEPVVEEAVEEEVEGLVISEDEDLHEQTEPTPET